MDNQSSTTPKDTESLILEAAIKEFSTKGYDGARTVAIAAEAGVTHAMLHYYFRTKEKLFERIFRDKIKYILNMILSPMINTQGCIKERISNGIRTHFDFLLDNKELPIFFITTLNSRPALYTEVIKELASTADTRIKALQSELDKAAEAGEITHVTASALLCDMASVNVFPFLAYPMLMAATGAHRMTYTDFMESRKEENIELILKRIS